MPSIDDIAAEYVERAAALDPCYATYAGIAGHDHELADLGADGFAGRAGLDRSTVAALDAAEAPDPREQVARAAMRERLALAGECYDTGDTTEKDACGLFRTRTFNASQISGITLARGHYQQFGSFWVPYVHLHGSGSIRFAGLMTGGTRARPPATLVALTQEIASLLGVQMRS
jgi:hypothetical protein